MGSGFFAIILIFLPMLVESIVPPILLDSIELFVNAELLETEMALAPRPVEAKEPFIAEFVFAAPTED